MSQVRKYGCKHVQRDLLMCKHACMHARGKRGLPTYGQRGLRMGKEAYLWAKRPTYAQRDLLMRKHTCMHACETWRMPMKIGRTHQYGTATSLFHTHTHTHTCARAPTHTHTQHTHTTHTHGSLCAAPATPAPKISARTGGDGAGGQMMEEPQQEGLEHVWCVIPYVVLVICVRERERACVCVCECAFVCVRVCACVTSTCLCTYVRARAHAHTH